MVVVLFATCPGGTIRFGDGLGVIETEATEPTGTADATALAAPDATEVAMYGLGSSDAYAAVTVGMSPSLKGGADGAEKSFSLVAMVGGIVIVSKEL